MANETRLYRIVRDALKTVSEQARHFQKYRREFNAERRARTHALIDFVGDIKLQMTAFSDCYIVSDVRPAWHVLAAVQALGSRFLEEGMLTRGGVVLGLAHHSGSVVFGPAVIEAYRLESEVAKYPRILVADEVRQAAWGYHEGLCRGRLFTQDSDGCWFVNVIFPPLSDWEALSIPKAEKDLRSHLRKIRKTLLKLLDETGTDIKHRSNVRWLINQFNIVARTADAEPIDRE